MIVTTYTIFVFIPDTVVLIIHIFHGKTVVFTQRVLIMMYSVDFMADAFFCVYINRVTRSKALIMLREMRACMTGN